MTMPEGDYDILKEVVGFVDAIEDDPGIVQFSTKESVRRDLKVSAIIFLDSFRRHPDVILDLERISRDPLEDILGILGQVEDEVGGIAPMKLGPSEMNIANELLLRLLHVVRETAPNQVNNKVLGIDSFNLSYIRAGGLASPVYVEYLREREKAQ